MVPSSWTIRTDVVARQDVESWLESEAQHKFVLLTQKGQVVVDFHDISDAFRFRMKFDDVLL